MNKKLLTVKLIVVEIYNKNLICSRIIWDIHCGRFLELDLLTVLIIDSKIR